MQFRMHDYKHVVFDWNGTIVDDTGLALQSLNRVRTDVGFPSVDYETYRRLFGFPISEFYRSLGFDFKKTPFADLVSRYLAYFDAEVGNCAVCSGFIELATAFRARQISISVLSASQQDTLLRVADSKSIVPLIDNLFGLVDEMAASKLERARELDLLINSRSPGSVLMIGDTDHDYHVAQDRRWEFVAIASGHQDRARLELLGVPVLDSLNDLARLLD